MRQGRRKGRVSLIRRKAIGESVDQHGRRERLLDVDPPPPRSRPHLNGAGPGVEVEGPRGVAIAVVRSSDSGVAAGATTTVVAAGAAVVVPPSSTSRLSRVVGDGHRRRWCSTPGEGASR
jgi:hypothetical protein